MVPFLSFSSELSDRVRASPCRFIVTGANGWLGKATLEMLRQALGADFSARVTALGSRQAQVGLAGGHSLSVESLLDWKLPPGQPAIIFHYAFLTKDKIGDLHAQDYVARNEAISSAVRAWIVAGNVCGVVLPSSGAVYDHLFAKVRDLNANLYGQLKYNDEVTFSAACMTSGAGLIIPRVFNLSGPYINKFDSYALASFISQILRASPIIIKARRPVIRSYYFIGDLIELCLQLLFKQPATSTTTFDVAGDEVVELGELAQRVAMVLAEWNPAPVQRLPMLDDAVEDRYIGNRNRIQELEIGLSIRPMKLENQIMATSQYIESVLRHSNG